MQRAIIVLLVLLFLGAGAFYVLTVPRPVDRTVFASLEGDAARGELVFHAGGCVSCHAGGEAEGGIALGGGEPLPTPIGTFHPPNISPHPEAGIGAWSLADFAGAMQRGLTPDGTHLYPAFPYGSYAKMEPQEVADLFAYLQTLPAVDTAKVPDEIAFPFNLRRGVGLWKLAFLSGEPVIALPDDAPEAVVRGRHLVEALGHCGECHSPRTLAGYGGLDASRWLAGAPNPEGEGTIPNITPAGAIADWSEDDIAYYLESGFTPDFDSAGGPMAEVVENTARLPAEDREAIAAYLKAVPAVE